jgi:hypothetical protein
MRSTIVVVVAALALGVAGCGGGAAAAVDELAPGDCFDDPAVADAIIEIDLVDCGVPHDNEVFARLAVEQTVYPGDDVISSFALDSCLGPFEAYVGESYRDSPLDYTFLAPTEESWNTVGNRVVTCILYSADLAELTGSMAAGR